MKTNLHCTLLVLTAAVVAGASSARAVITIPTVPVGNPGNAGELSGAGAGGYGPNRVCGAVAYSYAIGTYEVTTAQYTAFLNAVAPSDPYGLYNPNMDAAVYYYGYQGCNIQRRGTAGSYSYTVGSGSAADLSAWGNRPVNFVSWGDAARFANWLHNGQPTGPQNAGTTEDGAYLLNGATGETALLAVTRKATAKWALPSEDEWYKAAYYNPAAGTYWDYPTQTNTAPSNLGANGYLDPGNHANYQGTDYTLGSPYYRTNVGEFEHSAGPYGTFDQGGNIFEWTEGITSGSMRNLRGGSWDLSASFLQASYRAGGTLTNEGFDGGFRVVAVPEPASLGLLGWGALGLLARRKREANRQW